MTKLFIFKIAESDIHPIVVIMLLLASLNSCTNPWVSTESYLI